MVYPREILNRLKWGDGENIDDATIWYMHRGAPGDILSVSGSEIRALGRGFFEVDDASIPYHRVTRIEYRGEVVFDKEHERSRGKDRL
ncbi:MAG: RNA repair domain-containing protein [Thermoplasmata archaeon]|nr:RNA repair domain-containing protein [Thermoplasmata archaeon]